MGENLIAVFKELPFEWGFWETHAGVMTLALPFCLMLSFIPSLKGLAPVMAVGTFLLLATLVLLGVVGVHEYDERPPSGDLPQFSSVRAPLALCAILYSYEGICLVLPVESAMKEPAYFGPTFALAMCMVALTLALFSSLCVWIFGEVNNGSVTAFLITHYEHSPELRWLLLTANTTISFSVLLSYPIQLVPALELLAPLWRKLWDFGSNSILSQSSSPANLVGLTLPSLPERDAVNSYHGSTGRLLIQQGSVSFCRDSDNEDTEVAFGETRNGVFREDSVRSLLSTRTSALVHSWRSPKMTIPGDSYALRTTLVFLTYLIAVAVPNIEALISLAGALAGSSTALIIPPLLELAWLRHDFQKTFSTLPWSTRLHLFKSYTLVVGGLIFMFIGTSAALADIVAVYQTG